MTSMPIASASEAAQDGQRQGFPPCKQSTIDTRRREIIAAVRAAVAAGIPLDELTSLRELLRADRVEILIEHYWQKNGERPSLYTIDLASKLLALARSEALSDGRHREARRDQAGRRAVSLNRSHREEPKADPPDRSERRLARGRAASAKADGGGAKERKNQALPGGGHCATRDRHPDPDPSTGTHAEPVLNLHWHQSGQAWRTGSALHAGLPGL